MFSRIASLALLVSAVVPAAVSAPAAAQSIAVPYWAAIRSDTVNMRVGPGEDYRIEWVYHRAHLPLKVLRTMEGWRLVQDPDGARGWILSRFLTRDRGAIVKSAEMAEMRVNPADDAKLLWRLKPGVTGKLGDCTGGWCHLDLGGRAGYVRASSLWGAGEP